MNTILGFITFHSLQTFRFLLFLWAVTISHCLSLSDLCSSFWLRIGPLWESYGLQIAWKVFCYMKVDLTTRLWRQGVSRCGNFKQKEKNNNVQTCIFLLRHDVEFMHVKSCARCHWQLPSVWWRGCQSRSQPPTSSSPSIWSANAFSWGSLSPSYTWRIGNEDFFVTPKVKHVCIPRALPWLPCPSLGPPSRQ